MVNYYICANANKIYFKSEILHPQKFPLHLCIYNAEDWGLVDRLAASRHSVTTRYDHEHQNSHSSVIKIKPQYTQSSQHSMCVKEVKERIFTQHKMNRHKHVHWMATYRLRVHQFTTQQVGKGGKRRNEVSLNTKWVCTNMFIEWQLTSWECTSSQYSK